MKIDYFGGDFTLLAGTINHRSDSSFVAFPILGSSTWKDDEAQLVAARLPLIISENEFGEER